MRKLSTTLIVMFMVFMSSCSIPNTNEARQTAKDICSCRGGLELFKNHYNVMYIVCGSSIKVIQIPPSTEYHGKVCNE